jgi:AraC-like DNA-binding protein
MLSYRETKPGKFLLNHVESFWEINTDIQSDNFMQLPVVPEAVFDILFVTKPFFIYNFRYRNYSKFYQGVYFTGLRTESISFLLEDETNIFGIRLKPFSLSKISRIPLCNFKNSIVRIGDIFKNTDRKELNIIINGKDFREKTEYAKKFVTQLVEKQQDLDHTLRDELNYIMDSFGNIKIFSLCSDFCTNKTSLRNYYLRSVGLLPKELAKIWRMNYFLMLRMENSSENLTTSGLDAGYFDQAHLIKDFKTFFFSSPLQFINKQQEDFKIIQERIKRRFSSYYSPR